MFWSKLFCGNPIFWPFCYTGSWEEVKKVEEVHGDEAEEEGKEKSVDACGGSDDDIHGGVLWKPSVFCRIEIFGANFSLWQISMQLFSINSEPHFLLGRESRKKHLELGEKIAIDST